MQKFFKQKNKGFTLIEALVAILIFTMSLLGIISILATSIVNIEYAKQKMTATYLAQEGVEYVRNIRDSNALSLGGPNGWDTFVNAVIKLDNPSDPLYARTISKKTISADEVIITSEVTWPKGTVSFSEKLYNWIE